MVFTGGVISDLFVLPSFPCLMCVFGLMLSEGELFVRLLWWCVMCCVMCLCLCWSWSTVNRCVLTMANPCEISAVLSCGGSFLLFVWSVGCLSILCFWASMVVLLLLFAPSVFVSWLCFRYFSVLFSSRSSSFRLRGLRSRRLLFMSLVSKGKLFQSEEFGFR